MGSQWGRPPGRPPGGTLLYQPPPGSPPVGTGLATGRSRARPPVGTLLFPQRPDAANRRQATLAEAAAEAQRVSRLHWSEQQHHHAAARSRPDTPAVKGATSARKHWFSDDSEDSDDSEEEGDEVEKKVDAAMAGDQAGVRKLKLIAATMFQDRERINRWVRMKIKMANYNVGSAVRTAAKEESPYVSRRQPAAPPGTPSRPARPSRRVPQRTTATPPARPSRRVPRRATATPPSEADAGLAPLSPPHSP